MFLTEWLILGASNPDMFTRTIRRLVFSLTALCAKYSGSNRSILGLQPVSIADDLATVVVTRTIIKGSYAHDCACLSQRSNSLTDYVFCF